MTREFVVEGTNTGANGIDYGPWIQWVQAENEDAAKAEAVRITKAQYRAIAHVCTVTSVKERK